MKILSRIEGDSDRTKNVLERLKALVEEEIVAKMNNITGDTSVLPSKTGEAPVLRKSISAKKIEEMLGKLKATGFTSYWA
jgi:enamine deaminase RidA (YjgF/YER057c/UK114 family)